MRHSDRVCLHFGPYRIPRHHLGQEVQCAIRAKMTIAGVSSGPIPWPYCVPRSRALVIYQDLERAIRKESTSAVAHWWGVSMDTVGSWRRALGIGQYNAGTVKLRRAGYDDPTRSRKIKAAKRGKRRPAKVRVKFRASLKRYHNKTTLARKSVK